MAVAVTSVAMADAIFDSLEDLMLLFSPLSKLALAMEVEELVVLWGDIWRFNLKRNVNL
jgi:hypothetical protein